VERMVTLRRGPGSRTHMCDLVGALEGCIYIRPGTEKQSIYPVVGNPFLGQG
jgi:hypothetical protein